MAQVPESAARDNIKCDIFNFMSSFQEKKELKWLKTPKHTNIMQRHYAMRKIEKINYCHHRSKTYCCPNINYYSFMG